MCLVDVFRLVRRKQIHKHIRHFFVFHKFQRGAWQQSDHVRVRAVELYVIVLHFVRTVFNLLVCEAQKELFA